VIKVNLEKQARASARLAVFNGEVTERKIDILYLLWLLRLPGKSCSTARRLKLL